SAQDALGLFAELWFLHRWTTGSPSVIDAWTASAGSRHDFQSPTRSVEVKAAARRADGAVLHRVQHLDQLADPEQGQLFLFSLHVVRDQLAQNTLPNLVERVAAALQGEPLARDEFSRKLGRRGYSPAHAHAYNTPYRVLSERLYTVTAGFPRLIGGSFANGLPTGIADVSYVIDMAVCDPWLVASGPDQWQFS
ncbi:MAG: PD-(D/E)XK motif protein, partial [Chloroflexota bacterium]|nr:PD-(D/E)XK motif protein [Chloroflexota bacterium]